MKENSENSSSPNHFPFRLNLQDARRIINIACINWKEILETRWSLDLLRYDYVLISERFYRHMRDACTKDQHLLLDEIFGIDTEVINLYDKSTIYNLEPYLKEGRSGESMIAIHAKEDKASKFWLNHEFNWRIEDCYLIPTKK